jgi:hypothetical protein
MDLSDASEKIPSDITGDPSGDIMSTLPQALMGYMGHINELTWQIKVMRNGRFVISLRHSIP